MVDPGPRIDSHIDALRRAAAQRGELRGVVLTHDHSDHSESAEDFGVPVHSPPDGDHAGPFVAVGTPGHSPDHVCLLAGRACFCGDLILGEGSTIVPPDGGSLAAYMASLERLRELDPAVLYPGHGPVIDDPPAKITEYVEHRMMRERRLLEALESGERSRQALLDHAWSDVPSELRPAAAAVLQAHVEKLEAEGRLPVRQSELRE